MTVATTTTKVTAQGNGSATVFSFSPLVLYANTDLVVTKVAVGGAETVLSEGTGASNYTMQVSTYPGTGSIVYPATGTAYLATGEKIVMKRELPLTQDRHLEAQGGYFPEDIEQALDRGVMIDLQQQEELDRCIKVPINDQTSLDELTDDLIAVVAIADDITAVVAIAADVTTVADVAADVTTCASNIAAIQGAPSEASAAAASATAAAASATAAAAAAASNLFSKVVNKNADYTVVADTDDGSLFALDSASGSLNISLPSIALSGEGERYGFLRISASNVVTLVRNGTDTINGVDGNYVVSALAGEILLVVADDASPDNWIVIPWTQASAGAGLSKSGSVISAKPTTVLAIACGAETDAAAAGTSLVTFHAPVALTLTGVAAGLTVAQTSGSAVTVDINKAGSSILSTKLTIDNGEDHSSTAATAPVLSSTAIAAGDKLTVDVDQVGDGTATGLKVYLMGYPS